MVKNLLWSQEKAINKACSYRKKALKEIDIYKQDRKIISVIKDQNILFLNRRGSRLYQGDDIHNNQGPCSQSWNQKKY